MMSVQPLWWRQVGLGFVRGVGEDVAVPVEQVKAALWGWSSRDRRGDRRSSSLEVEDGAAEPAGRRWTTDPHPGRWTRDVELLRWMMSSWKRLWLGSSEVADGGGWGFAAGAERLWRPGISNCEKGAMGGGEA